MASDRCISSEVQNKSNKIHLSMKISDPCGYGGWIKVSCSKSTHFCKNNIQGLICAGTCWIRHLWNLIQHLILPIPLLNRPPPPFAVHFLPLPPYPLYIHSRQPPALHFLSLSVKALRLPTPSNVSAPLPPTFYPLSCATPLRPRVTCRICYPGPRNSHIRHWKYPYLKPKIIIFVWVQSHL